MTAKEIVQSICPTATAEKQQINGEVYWLIREYGKYTYMVEGKTQSEAWKNARTKLMDDFNREMVG